MLLLSTDAFVVVVDEDAVLFRVELAFEVVELPFCSVDFLVVDAAELGLAVE